MKLSALLVLITGSLLFSGCESTAEPAVGMTEKVWLRNTVLSDMIYQEGNVKAYKANRQYYYFRDGILVKIDLHRLPADEIAPKVQIPQMSAPAPSAPPSTDIYTELKKLDELRKEKIITEEEFQAQKKKILERK